MAIYGHVLSSYNSNKFGAISTAAQSDALFGQLKSKLDAVEYGPLYLDANDMAAHLAVAPKAKSHHVELWTTTFRLVDMANSSKHDLS